MDFELTDLQKDLLKRLEAVLPHPASGPVPAGLEEGLFAKLRDEGFLNLASGGNRSGVLDSSLVIERVSAAAGIVPVGVHALVVPLLFDRAPAGIVAIQDEASEGPYRYAGNATVLIRYEADQAKAYVISPQRASAPRTNYVYPFAMPGPVEGKAIAVASASDVKRRQRIGIAAECVGAMQATLDQLVAYLSAREQFGRKLGSFQALQHRLAELSVLLESSRWISREAGWLDDNESAALAATFCTKAARRFCWESHQLTGARGFTIDFGMYRHTLRLQALSVEAGSVQAHADDAALIVWGERQQVGG